MSKAVRVQVIRTKDISAPASRLKDAKAKQALKIGDLHHILSSNGYRTLQEQAKVLNLSRSTAWFVLSGGHKGSGLSATVIKRILLSSALPTAARQLIEEYVTEKLLGAYGHERARLKHFKKQLS